MDAFVNAKWRNCDPQLERRLRDPLVGDQETLAGGVRAEIESEIHRHGVHGRILRLNEPGIEHDALIP